MCFMASGMCSSQVLPGMLWSLTPSSEAQKCRRQTLCWALGWTRTVSRRVTHMCGRGGDSTGRVLRALCCGQAAGARPEREVAPRSAADLW